MGLAGLLGLCLQSAQGAGGPPGGPAVGVRDVPGKEHPEECLTVREDGLGLECGVTAALGPTLRVHP